MGRKGPRWRRPLEKQGAGSRTPIGAREAVCMGGIFFTLSHILLPACSQDKAGLGRARDPPPQLPGLRVSQELMGLPLPDS